MFVDMRVAQKVFVVGAAVVVDLSVVFGIRAPLCKVVNGCSRTEQRSSRAQQAIK